MIVFKFYNYSELSFYFQISTMTIFMKVLSILFITKSCHTVELSRLKDLLNELDQYLTEIDNNKPTTTQVPQKDVNNQYIVNKRLPPLPWNKRLSSSSDSERPLPPLPWHKRWDKNELDKNIFKSYHSSFS